MALYMSSDGGSNWDSLLFDSLLTHTYGYISCIGIDPQYPNIIYAGGSYSNLGPNQTALFKSTNGGITWSDFSFGLYDYPNLYLNDFGIDPKNSSILYAGANQGILKSTDGGLSWEIKTAISNVYSVVVSPTYSRRVFAGARSGIYYSPDGGENWFNSSQGLKCQYVTSLKFHPTSPETLYAGTYGSGLYKTLEETGVEEEQEAQLPEKISLYQNYPNPFNPTTTIHYTVHGSQFMVHSPIHTTLTIYNVLGQKVRTLVDEFKLPGEHRVIWDGKDEKGNPVSSGVYFYKLKVGDFSQVKKMLLIK